MRAHFSRMLLKALGLAVAYFCCAMVSRYLKSNPHFASIVWLPWGLLLGALAVSPRREWFWLLLATAPADYVFNLLGPDIPFGHWIISRSFYYCSAYLGLRFTEKACGGPVRLRTVREALALFIITGLGTQLIASTNFAIGQRLLGEPRPFANLWLMWCISNFLSFVLLTPVIILWFDRHSRQLTQKLRARIPEALLLLIAWVAAYHFAAAGVRISILGIQSCMLIFVIWAALRLGAAGVAAANSIVIVTVAIFPMRVFFVAGHHSPVEEGLFALTLTLAAVGFAGMVIALALESQQQSEALLVGNNAELKEAMVTKDRKAAELEHTNALLQQAVLRAENLSRELAAANRALNASDQARLEFVRSLSHELRNPIAGARLLAETLLRSDLSGEAPRRQIAGLKSCVEYLQTLLDETLDISQLESGHVAIKLESFTVAELLGSIATIFGKLAEDKNLAFVVDAGADADRVLIGNTTHTKRILINYLTNALKFTAQGSVDLKVQTVDQAGEIVRLRFSVCDTGPGVNPSLQKRIFTKFIRESSQDHKLGAGLGLALCRQLAELAGGTVGFDSPPGGGAVFWAELPFIASAASSATTTDEPEDRPDFSGLAVCVIDDNPLLLEAMTALLGEFGVVPETFQNIDAALDGLRQQRFDLVLTDYHLPDATGIQLLEQARRCCPPGHLQRTRFYLITGLWDHELAAKAARAGYHGSYKKPLSVIELYRILKSTSAEPLARVA